VFPALKKIKLVIFDVDGTLTDGRIVINSDGTESRFFHVQDGTGIKYLMRNGVDVAFLSARQSKVVEKRAEELGVKHVLQGSLKKIDAYNEILKKTSLKDENVCIVADDLLELPLMKRAGFSAAVANAVKEVREAADYVTTLPGGMGAGREVAELILGAQDKWNDVLRNYTGGEKA
jgi:3-deoxy-D-manno-octulosonate 8-phosphate phosphatase (KDO 8-P phosphatase)